MQVEAPNLEGIWRISTVGFTYICSHILGATLRLRDIDYLPRKGTQTSSKVEDDGQFTLEKHADHLVNTLAYEHTLDIEVAKC